MAQDDNPLSLKIVLLLIDSNEGKILGDTAGDTLGLETHL
jgi:hypothetical protein